MVCNASSLLSSLPSISTDPKPLSALVAGKLPDEHPFFTISQCLNYLFSNLLKHSNGENIIFFSVSRMDTRLRIGEEPAVPILGVHILEINLISEDINRLLPLSYLNTLIVLTAAGIPNRYGRPVVNRILLVIIFTIHT